MRTPRISPRRLVIALASAVLLLPTTPAAAAAAAATPGDAPEWSSTEGYFHEIVLDWTTTPGATSYDVFRATGRGTPAHLTTVTDSKYRDKSAVPGTTYLYQVAARDAEGIGPRSVARRVKAPIQSIIFGAYATADTIGPPGYYNLTEITGEVEQTGQKRSVPSGLADFPAVSPDGARVAYVGSPDGFYADGIKVARLDGTGSPIQVSETGTAPVWAPGGKKLLFAVREPSPRLWWVPWNGSPGDPVAYPGSGGCSHASWLPDPSGVVASCRIGDVRRLYRITTGGTRTAIANTVAGYYPAVSPDGTALAYVSLPASSPSRLRLVTLGGGLLRTLGNGAGVRALAWSPNGRRLYFTNDAGIMTVLRSSGGPTVFHHQTPKYTGIYSGVAVRRGDDTAPWVAVTSQLPQLTTEGAMTLRWRGLDSQSGVRAYQTRIRRASWNGVLGAWSRRSTTTATARSWALPNGGELCVQVRGIDKAGNASSWGTPRCQTRFLDDPALTRKGGWSTYSVRGLYGGTASSTGKQGATLGLSGAKATRVSLLVTKCPRCGKVTVYWGASKIASVNLRATTTRHRQVLTLPAFAARKSGTLRIVKADPSPRTLIRIDGVALRGH